MLVKVLQTGPEGLLQTGIWMMVDCAKDCWRDMVPELRSGFFQGRVRSFAKLSDSFSYSVRDFESTALGGFSVGYIVEFDGRIAVTPEEGISESEFHKIWEDHGSVDVVRATRLERESILAELVGKRTAYLFLNRLRRGFEWRSHDFITSSIHKDVVELSQSTPNNELRRITTRLKKEDGKPAVPLRKVGLDYVKRGNGKTTSKQSSYGLRYLGREMEDFAPSDDGDRLDMERHNVRCFSNSAAISITNLQTNVVDIVVPIGMLARKSDDRWDDLPFVIAKSLNRDTFLAFFDYRVPGPPVEEWENLDYDDVPPDIPPQQRIGELLDDTSQKSEECSIALLENAFTTRDLNIIPEGSGGFSVGYAYRS